MNKNIAADIWTMYISQLVVLLSWEVVFLLFTPTLALVEMFMINAFRGLCFHLYDGIYPHS